MQLPDPDPRVLARSHFAMMFLWAALLVPTVLWWKESILWVAAMSLYANFVGHFSAWDAARAEAEVAQIEAAAANDAPAQTPPLRDEVPEIASLRELAIICRAGDDLYLRVSRGPREDRRGGAFSTDDATGLPLPGLSAIPLSPPAWWRDRPDIGWVARQVCAYTKLLSDDTSMWVMRGNEVGRGPDNEPLIDVIDVVAEIDEAVIEEAANRQPTA